MCFHTSRNRNDDTQFEGHLQQTAYNDDRANTLLVPTGQSAPFQGGMKN